VTVSFISGENWSTKRKPQTNILMLYRVHSYIYDILLPPLYLQSWYR